MASEEATTVAPTSPTLDRRVKASSWGDPMSPVVYAKIDVDVTDVEPNLRAVSLQTGTKVTLTSLIVWALSKAIAENPDANNVVRAGELKQMTAINLTIGVALPESDSVISAKVPDADKLTITEVAQKIKKDKDAIHEYQKKKLNSFTIADWLVPASVVRFFQNTATAFETDWGLNLSWLGVDSAQYQPSSALVTCLHKYELTEAYATFPTNQPTPLAVSIGLVTERPWVIDGAVKPRRIVTLCFTIDHRVVDGRLGGRLMKATKKHVEAFVRDPASHCSSKKAKL